jgi:RND family efflux transporter MFP subunit
MHERPRLDTVYVKLSYNADVLPIQQANIYAKINGNLERMYVDIGQHVAEGQLLALIDTLELSQLAQQAQATYENALRNFERAKDLADQQLIAKQELDNTIATLKVAKANYDAAFTRLRYAHINAPLSGYITKRLVDAGVNLKSNDIALQTLMNTDKMKIYVSVLEKDIPLIQGKKESSPSMRPRKRILWNGDKNQRGGRPVDADDGGADRGGKCRALPEARNVRERYRPGRCASGRADDPDSVGRKRRKR